MANKKIKICYMLPDKKYDKGRYNPKFPSWHEASLKEFIAELEKNRLFEHIEGWMTDNNEILIYVIRQDTYGNGIEKINWKEKDEAD